MQDNKILTQQKEGGRLVFGKRLTPEEKADRAQTENQRLKAELELLKSESADTTLLILEIWEAQNA